MADACLDRPYVDVIPALFRGMVRTWEITPSFPTHLVRFEGYDPFRLPGPSHAIVPQQIEPWRDPPALQSAEEVTESPSSIGPCDFGLLLKSQHLAQRLGHTE